MKLLFSILITYFIDTVCSRTLKEPRLYVLVAEISLTKFLVVGLVFSSFASTLKLTIDKVITAAMIKVEAITADEYLIFLKCFVSGNSFY